MSKNEYTCFIISPIGSKRGDDKQKQTYDHANTVFNALILPTLRYFGFREGNVVRADHETDSGRITDSIDRHLREDDLCIVDLTGLNANVMYEYGVRVGIGKPIIAITEDNLSQLPFDIKDINTLQYDIQSVTSLMDSQKALEKKVGGYLNNGFSPKKGQGSFADLSNRLSAIESSLAKLIANTGPINAQKNDGDVAEIIRQTGGPHGAFNYALRTRNVHLGEQLMPVLSEALSRDRYIYLVVGQLAALGSRIAAKELKESWSFIEQTLTLKQQYEEISSYISYCNRSDTEEQELRFIQNALNGLDRRIQISELDDSEKNKLRAGIYNQTSRLYYGLYSTSNSGTNSSEEHGEWLKKAIESIETAVELVPNEASYLYNLATCLDKAGQIDRAKTAMDECLNVSDQDSDHLRLAYKIYIKAGEGEKAKVIKEKLNKINPYVAALL